MCDKDAMGFKLNGNITLSAETLEAFLLPSVDAHDHRHPDTFVSTSGDTNKNTTVKKEMTSFTNNVVIK